LDAQLDAIGVGLLLVWIRTAAVLLLAPILGGRPLPPWVALPLSAALSFAFAPGALGGAAMTPEGVLALALREAAAGAVLGLGARIAFSIFESAGQLVGAAADPGAAASRDPDARSPFTLLYAMVGVGAFLLAGGHRALVLALDGSFRTCAVGAWDGGGAGADAAIALFSGAFAGAVMIAAPAFAAGLAADGAAAVAARLAPRAGLEASAPALRAVCVQLVAVGVLAVAVEAGVDFLNEGLARAAGVS
jgi:flagellar biosynthesis protein FliR